MWDYVSGAMIGASFALVLLNSPLAAAEDSSISKPCQHVVQYVEIECGNFNPAAVIEQNRIQVGE